MVDDNAYRVVLTSSATLADAQRTAIGDHMIQVAKFQKQILDEHGQHEAAEPALLEARAKLAQVIGQGVATSEQFIQRRSTAKTFRTGNTERSAESQLEDLTKKTSTLLTDQPGTLQIGA